MGAKVIPIRPREDFEIGDRAAWVNSWWEREYQCKEVEVVEVQDVPPEDQRLYNTHQIVRIKRVDEPKSTHRFRLRKKRKRHVGDTWLPARLIRKIVHDPETQEETE